LEPDWVSRHFFEQRSLTDAEKANVRWEETANQKRLIKRPFGRRGDVNQDLTIFSSSNNL
jgi:hypothetical protein